MASPSRTDLENAARTFFDELASEIDRPRDFDVEHHDEDVALNVETSRDRTRAIDDQLRGNKFDGLVQHRAEELAARCGAAFEQMSKQERLFALQLAARIEREQMELLIHGLTKPATGFRHFDDVFSSGSDPRTFKSVSPPLLGQVVSQTAKRSATLGMVIDDFTARMRKRGLGLSQIDEVGRVLRWLVEEIDPATPVNQVTTDQLREFRDNVQRMDRTRRGRASSFRRRLTDLPERQIASATAQKYWSSVQAVFAWAHQEGMSTSDPAALFKIDRKKGEVRRSPEPFASVELQRLYMTPLYAGHLSPSRLTQPGDCRERGQHWWTGVLPLFSGLRAGELTQLLPSDFDFDAPIPHLLVQETDLDGLRTKSVKTGASIRAVPLAPILLDLGLRQFVERRAKIQPKARVFEKLRLGTGGKISEGMARFWGDYLRKFALHRPGRATHVMRHTIIETLRVADVPEEDIAAVVGHSRRTQTSRYGNHDFPLARKLGAISKLNFGFEIFERLGGAYREKDHKA